MPQFPSFRRSLLVSVVVSVAACAGDRDRIVLLAPSSMAQSGFLDSLIDTYQAESGVRIHLVTSTRVFDRVRASAAEVVISHDPDREQQLVEQGAISFYRKFMFNHFVLVGPPHDPADVRQAQSIADAFRRIAADGAPFVSRGDGSSTYEREQRIWMTADAVTPARLEIGNDMIAALFEASARGAYCLTLPTVFERFRDELKLAPLFDRDDRLLNAYAVLVTKRGTREAKEFAGWLAEADGRTLVDRFRIAGRRPFSLWPVTAPSKTPDALPYY